MRRVPFLLPPSSTSSSARAAAIFNIHTPADAYTVVDTGRNRWKAGK
jgi:hypothetical protein